MAMNMDAMLKIRAQVDGANNIIQLNRGLQSVESTAKGVTGAMRGMTGAAAGLSGALGTLTPLLSVAGLVGLVKNAVDAGDAMHDLAQSTGVSVESLARFKKAAAVSGTDLESVSKALVKLSKAMLDAGTGGAQSQAAFKALGISVKDSSGKLKSADSVFLEIANRFKQMPDGAAKTALALKYFGRAGADMIPLLNMGGDAIDKLKVKMTDAFANKMDDYKDRLAILSGKVGELGMSLAIALLPALEGITSAVTKAVDAFNQLPDSLKAVAVTGATIAIAWGPISGLMKSGAAAFAVAANGLEILRYQAALAGGVMPLLTGGIEALSAAIYAIPGWGWALAGVAALTALGVALYNNDKDFKNWADNIWTVVKEDFQSAMQAIADSAKNAFDYVKESMKGVTETTANVTNGVADAFAKMFSWLANQAQKAFANMSATVAGWWNSLPAPIRGALQKAGSFAGVAAQIVGIGPVATLMNRENQRAFEKGATSSKSQSNKPASLGAVYTPDLGALNAAGNAQAAQKRNEDLKNYNSLLEKTGDFLSSIKRKTEDVTNATASFGLTGRQKIDQDYKESLINANREIEDFAKRYNELVKERSKTPSGINTDKLDASITAAFNQLEALKKALPENAQAKRLQDLVDLYQSQSQAIDEATASSWEFARAQQYNNDIMGGLKDGLQSYIEQIGTMREAISNLTSDAFKSLEDVLVSLVTTGKANFQEFAASILEATSRMIIQQLVLKTIMQAIGAIGGGGSSFSSLESSVFNTSAVTNQTGLAFSGISLNANGNVFAANGIVPYAMGGVVNQPTLFKFASGGTMRNGLLGEAGPEAIIPLKRGADGKLGVAGGGGGTVVNVSVDAKGTNVQGDNNQGAALGRVIAGAVQAELIKQKRPGGLLAA